MSSTGFKVKTPIPVKPNNTTTQNPSSLMSFLDDSKNVDFQYSSISSQSSQRDVKPKAGFSVSKTNGALVDYM
jgi:hypothetical protein